MSMTVRVFAALNGFGDDLAEAKKTMEKHGYEAEYADTTRLLEPVFIEAGWVGGLESLKLLHDCLPQSDDPKVQEGINLVHEVLDFMLNKFHEKLYPEPKPEPVVLTLESVLRLIDTAFDRDVKAKG